ncbi:MAG: hypothetical protein II840_10915, partial [Kiritimatiellae bacterium]|nr:hypothetical protein [Kiritimatiellia bacterium]
GDVVGRNGGIRGWLKENLPELSPKYKTLMRYKAMAIRLRQATGTKDPTPTAALLDETPRHAVVEEILSGEEPVFDRVFKKLDHILSPETVLLDEPRALKNFPHRILKKGEAEGVARHLRDGRKRQKMTKRRRRLEK